MSGKRPIPDDVKLAWEIEDRAWSVRIIRALMDSLIWLGSRTQRLAVSLVPLECWLLSRAFDRHQRMVTRRSGGSK